MLLIVLVLLGAFVSFAFVSFAFVSFRVLVPMMGLAALVMMPLVTLSLVVLACHLKAFLISKPASRSFTGRLESWDSQPAKLQPLSLLYIAARRAL